MTPLEIFQHRLGIEFKDIKLLERAFIHRSYLNEHPKLGLEHNERLEFLGDAVLELVVTDYLYRNYPNPEGDLTNWRSALVKTESLAAVAEKLEISQYFKLSRGEAKGNSRSHALISANAVEAVIGAIYLDQGYDAAGKFITDHIVSRLPEILESGTWLDPKSKFQETAQDQYGLTPNYRVMDESGPDHDKVFTIGVFVGDKLFGKGSGSSKQAAQQEAAAHALAKLAKHKEATAK
ncbi:MAG: putative ribonuclease [Candidatus Saccharibacteria bacterium]|jgi:ribonuclease-3|nr:putative ribonuclease [Candidatus Saccharibacteria bacterium]